MSRILLFTDAWKPQVSGVVRTISEYVKYLRSFGHTVRLITPSDFEFNFPCPTYPEVNLSILTQRAIEGVMYSFCPEKVHIFTEGPIGIQAVRYCNKHKLKYTTSLLTRFDLYVGLRSNNYMERLTRKFMLWFHSGAESTFVSTIPLKVELESLGFKSLVVLPKGIDSSIFNPEARSSEVYSEYPSPILLYVGRMSVEKNLKAFLDLDVIGTKVLVGDGPARKGLESAYPEAKFLGYKFGKELAGLYASADVFVLSSVSETFGLIMIESMACGTPVAALPSDASNTVIEHGVTGYVGDLLEGVEYCLRNIDRDACINASEKYRWDNATKLFYDHLTNLSIISP